MLREAAPRFVQGSLLARLTDAALILGQANLKIGQILPLPLLERYPFAIFFLGRVQQMSNPDVQVLEYLG